MNLQNGIEDSADSPNRDSIIKIIPVLSAHRSTCFGLLLSYLLSLSFVGCGPGASVVEQGIATQTLHVGNGQEPQELDPHLITGTSEIKILSALFEGLVGQHPQDLSPVPGAARTWTLSGDARTYTFTLQENLRWSNGDPLTSEDFAFSIERMLSQGLGAPNSYLLFGLNNAEAFYEGKCSFEEVGVSTKGPQILELELDNPAPYFLSLLSHPAWFPVHRPTLETLGNPFGRATGWTRVGNMVSNGPFILDAWKVNEYVKVSKSPLYWDREATRLNEIYFYPTESRDAEGRAFSRGQLHLTEAVPVSKVAYYRKRGDPSLQIDTYLGTYYLQLNTRQPPLSDSRVRRALSLVIDRDLIVEKITQGDQQPAWHFTPPGTAGYEAKIGGEKDIEEARRLLSEAGFAGGDNFPKLTYLYNTSENNKAIAEVLQQMWSTGLGIEIELVNQEWKVFTQTRQTGEFDILRSSWVGDYLDPTTFLDVWTSRSGNNFTGWQSEEYDHWLADSQSTRSTNARYAKLQKAEALLIAEQPIIPLYYYTSVYLKHTAVKGYYPTLLNYHPWKHVYLEKPPQENPEPG